MPLYDDTAKIGFGVWNYPIIGHSLEALLLFVGWYSVVRNTKPVECDEQIWPTYLWCLSCFAIQSYVFLPNHAGFSEFRCSHSMNFYLRLCCGRLLA